MVDVFAHFRVSKPGAPVGAAMSQSGEPVSGSAEADRPRPICPPPLIGLAAVGLGLAMDYVAPAYILELTLALDTRIVVAAILALSGAALIAAAFHEFRRVGTPFQPWRPAAHLVTRGIFRFVRNPMYVGMMLLIAAVAIALASDWMIVTLFVAFLVLHFGVIRREEEYLTRAFGDEYAAYRRLVRRYGWPRLTARP